MPAVLAPEMESSRTSLASRTHFEVVGLGLEGQVLGVGLGFEASSSQKLPCPRLKNSTFFWIVKILYIAWKKNFRRRFSLKNAWKKSLKTFFFEIAWKNFWRSFFWRTLALVSLVLGLGFKHSCPWPSRGSVLRRARLGLGFFLCPWPRALCPRLHLWLARLRTGPQIHGNLCGMNERTACGWRSL